MQRFRGAGLPRCRGVGCKWRCRCRGAEVQRCRADSPESRSARKLRDAIGIMFGVSIDRCTEEFSTPEKKWMEKEKVATGIINRNQYVLQL